MIKKNGVKLTMELTIKSRKLESYINDKGHKELDMLYHEIQLTGDFETCAKKSGQIMNRFPDKTVLYGFLTSFLEICEMNNIEFDLTYDSVKNISLGLGALYSIQKNSYEKTKNKEIIIKTLAAVLSFLAINEHDFWFKTTSYFNQIKAGKVFDVPLWSDADTVAVGKKKYVDFLPCCYAAAEQSPFIVAGMSLNMTPVIEEYKNLTGIDLAQYGLSNLLIN